jgi:hypothetical protein
MPCEAATKGIIQLLHCAYSIDTADNNAQVSSSFFMCLIFISKCYQAQFSEFQHCMNKQKVAAYIPVF